MGEGHQEQSFPTSQMDLVLANYFLALLRDNIKRLHQTSPERYSDDFILVKQKELLRPQEGGVIKPQYKAPLSFTKHKRFRSSKLHCSDLQPAALKVISTISSHLCRENHSCSYKQLKLNLFVERLVP